MHILKKIFISPDEPRLRAGWRLLVQTFWLVVLMIGVMFPLAFVQGGTLTGMNVILGQVIQLFGFTLSVYLARRILDKRSFASLGLKLDRFVWRDVLAGIAITFVMMAFIFGVELALGWVQVAELAWQVDPLDVVAWQTALIFINFVLVGWNEELLSRGYHLQTLISGTNIFWGVLISSAVFGILHLGNPNATWVSAAGILLAGVFLAYGYLRTGQLWLPIGLHIGWNFFEGVVFGFPVSGLDVYRLVRIETTGPALWTGAAFGPEAGLMIVPALGLGAGLIWFYTRRTEYEAINR